MMEYHNFCTRDLKLVHMLIKDLELEGGSCLAELLVSFNTSLRNYLGDRKLISFLKGIYK